MSEDFLTFEPARECGLRQLGKLYLIGGKAGEPCDRLPLTLQECGGCGHIPTFHRGYQKINMDVVFGGKHKECVDKEHLKRCPICNPKGKEFNEDPEVKHLLMYVGKKFYSPEKFIEEAKQYGISKAISSIPEGLVLGKSWIFLAFPELSIETAGYTLVKEQIKYIKKDAIFHGFIALRLEVLITEEQNCNEDFVKALSEKGITPVVVPEKYKDFHKPKRALTYASKVYENWKLEQKAKQKLQDEEDNGSSDNHARKDGKKRKELLTFIPSPQGDPTETIASLEPKTFEEPEEVEETEEEISESDPEPDPEPEPEPNKKKTKTTKKSKKKEPEPEPEKDSGKSSEIISIKKIVDDSNKKSEDDSIIKPTDELNDGQLLMYNEIKSRLSTLFTNEKHQAPSSVVGKEFFELLQTLSFLKAVDENTAQMVEIADPNMQEFVIKKIIKFMLVNFDNGIDFFFPPQEKTQDPEDSKEDDEKAKKQLEKEVKEVKEVKKKASKKKAKKEKIVDPDCDMCEGKRKLKTDEEKERGLCSVCQSKVDALMKKSKSKKDAQDEEHSEDAKME